MYTKTVPCKLNLYNGEYQTVSLFNQIYKKNDDLYWTGYLNLPPIIDF